MKANIFLFPLLVLLLTMQVNSQNNRNKGRESTFDDRSFLIADVSYLNDAVFMGRRDSIAAPYLLPSIGYYDRSGLFIDVSASYLTASEEQRIDLFLVSGGYYFDKNKLSGGLMATGYFFNEESYNVQSEVTASLSGLISYDLKAFEASLGLSSVFTSDSSADFFSELSLERTFFIDGEHFLITPTVSIAAGTQNFYEAYYRSSRLGNRKDRPSGSSGTSAEGSLEITEASKFNVLNIELGLPIHYSYKSFIFSFSPSLALPQSSATITTDELTITEDLETVFYWSAGISYWFIFKKNSKTTTQ